MAILLYGANGYTGELVARRAAARGLAPSRLILAGRRAEALAPLAAELGFEARAFTLDGRDEIDRALRGVDVVLSCAGPFAQRVQRTDDSRHGRAGNHLAHFVNDLRLFFECLP